MVYHLHRNYHVHMSKSKIVNIAIISLIFLYINILVVFRNNSSDPKYLKIKDFENSYSKSFIENVFENQISYMEKFRETNVNNMLIEKTVFKKNENPDVSVIITAYNQANCFYASLRSVQNQSLKNIEIIIIDDCSLDNTTEVIEKYMEEDHRIIYLKHESNDGKMKSRSDGIRIAKGKYITIIDGDDALSDENILYKSFNIARLANLDVVEFIHAFFKRKKYRGINLNYRNIKNLNNRIIYQPELKFKFVDLNEPDSNAGFANRNIVSKLIKNEILKKVVEYIGPKYNEDYLLDYEDTIMAVSLFRLAKSYYYMNECGYYVSNEECEEVFPISTMKKCKPIHFQINKELDAIKYLNFLLDISNNTEIENNYIYKELIAINYYKKLDKWINKDFSYVYLVLDRIYNSNLSSKKRKDRISKIKDKLLKKENIIRLKDPKTLSFN